ncbi:MAG: DNA-binding protein [Rhodospirillaceae bacterium]|nr:DNA-binding protein [Rhodospirillaceae bacterium]
MMTHGDVWRAIDLLAENNGLSVSELARVAGLDRSTFAKSKRRQDGRPRWPSTESLSRVLNATNSNMSQFTALLKSCNGQPVSLKIPVIGFAQAGRAGFFDDSGYPVASGWETLDFPNLGDANAYALAISGDSMLPVYRKGDIIVVAPNAAVRPGDRVVAKTRGGEVLAKQLAKATTRQVRLASVNRSHEDICLPASDVVWISRIVWVSQ